MYEPLRDAEVIERAGIRPSDEAMTGLERAWGMAPLFV